MGTNKLLLITVVVVILATVGLVYLNSRENLSAIDPNKTYKVGILSGIKFFAASIDGFKEKMTELGYVEGKNITYDVVEPKNIVGNEDVIQGFIDDEVDLIFSFPTEPTLEAKKVSAGKVPIVFGNAGLDGVDIIDSVRTPGHNLTGVQFPTADNAVKRLEILREIVPNAKTIWLTYLENYPIVPEELRRLHQVADAEGLTLIEVPVKNLNDIKADLDKREKAGNIMDAILFIPEPIGTNPDVFALISNFSLKHKVPMGGVIIPQTKGGGLFSLLPDSKEVGAQVAVLADKILRGADVGKIPVVSSENYLTINNKAAKDLGITISEGLLSRARDIIK